MAGGRHPGEAPHHEAIVVREGSDLNRLVASLLREAADVLEQQGAEPFRVTAYRRGADTVDHLSDPVERILAGGGTTALETLPGVGRGIAAAISEIVRTGRWSQLERLRGELDAEHLFRLLPGVGSTLAGRLHDTLHVDTLEALEIAAHDGRLEAVEGVGRARAEAIRLALASLLGRRHRPRPRREPGVGDLLDVDAEYRRRAAAGELRTIAPRRFNPEHAAWLPVLHTRRGDWEITALFSNTARAHELDRTRDWVVLYFYDGEQVEGQRTVVTEHRGALEGRRVVRGREAECRGFHLDGEPGPGAR